MRQFKFRAFDKYNSGWLPPDLVRAMPLQQLQQETYIWSQFTGLKDFNGREIFEGDIVKNHTHISEVLFANGSFMTYLNDGDTSSRNLLLEMSQNSNNFEVIGNIYEHPELIK